MGKQKNGPQQDLPPRACSRAGRVECFDRSPPAPFAVAPYRGPGGATLDRPSRLAHSRAVGLSIYRRGPWSAPPASRAAAPWGAIKFLPCFRSRPARAAAVQWSHHPPRAGSVRAQPFCCGHPLACPWQPAPACAPACTGGPPALHPAQGADQPKRRGVLHARLPPRGPTFERMSGGPESRTASLLPRANRTGRRSAAPARRLVAHLPPPLPVRPEILPQHFDSKKKPHRLDDPAALYYGICART